MPDLIQFEEKLLAHHFQCTNLSGILLRSKVYLSITTLTDLCKNLEITMTESCTALSKVGPFSTQIFVSGCFIFLCGCGWRSRKLGVEKFCTAMAVVHVAEEVKVMVKEI